MSNDLMNAVKRLERVGGENSYTTHKLRAAVNELHDVVVQSVRTAELWEVELPRNYKVVLDDDGSTWELRKSDYDMVDAVKSYRIMRDADGKCYYALPAQRDVVQAFANDVADGWLLELSQFIESRTAASQEALEAVRKAQEIL